MASIATSNETARVQDLRVDTDKMLGKSNATVYAGIATVDGARNTPVAVKVFPLNLFAGGAQAQQRQTDIVKDEYNKLHDAAQVAAGGICKTYGVVDDPTHKACIVMKPYDRTLQKELDGLNGAPMSVDRVLSVAHQVAHTLRKLHDGETLYLDLKPANIFVDAQAGTVVLGDFGIARLVANTCGLTNPTDGSIGGTANYMSPEQAGADEWGDDSGRSARVTVKSDSWTFGATLAHLLTGVLPWSKEAARRNQMWIRVRLSTWRVPSWVPPPSIPPKLSELVEWCLKPNPDDRPGFDMIVERLEEIMPETLPSPAPVPGPSPAPTPAAVPGPPPPNRDLKIALLDFEEELQLYEKESRAEAVAQNNKIGRQEADLSRLKEQQEEQERQQRHD